MKLLLDTHIILWGLFDPNRLSKSETEAFRDPAVQVFISTVSLWEIAIKMRTGRLKAPDSLPGTIAANPDFEVLSILPAHAWRVRLMPRLHGDQFDHLLMAQAQCEGMTLVSRDRWMAAYGVAMF